MAHQRGRRRAVVFAGMNYTNGWIESGDTPAHAERERRARRISRADRRERLLEAAEGEFACKGLRGTTTAALAERAGISEPVLHIHFENKDRLFKEAVERGIERRLRLLEAKLARVRKGTLVECVESMAEATVAVCVSDATNAVLTGWALLEAPEDAVELHRKEVGSMCLLWEEHLAVCIHDRRSRALMSMRVVPYSVQACVAYGFWLAAVRHNPASAGPLGNQFAKGIALAAAMQMTCTPEEHHAGYSAPATAAAVTSAAPSGCCDSKQAGGPPKRFCMQTCSPARGEPEPGRFRGESVDGPRRSRDITPDVIMFVRTGNQKHWRQWLADVGFLVITLAPWVAMVWLLWPRS